MCRMLACVNRMRTRLVCVAASLAWCGLSVGGAAQAPGAAVPPVPLADHHQHVFSPAIAQLFADTPPVVNTQPRTAADLVAQLDAAGIRRAVVLSTAYLFEQPSRQVADAHEKVSAENDWTSREVAQYPDRLIGFCALNPLKDYAVAELDRCAADPNLRSGGIRAVRDAHAERAVSGRGEHRDVRSGYPGRHRDASPPQRTPCPCRFGYFGDTGQVDTPKREYSGQDPTSAVTMGIRPR